MCFNLYSLLVVTGLTNHVFSIDLEQRNRSTNTKYTALEKKIAHTETVMSTRVESLKEIKKQVEEAAYDLHAKRLILNNLAILRKKEEDFDNKITDFKVKEQLVLQQIRDAKEDLRQKKIEFSKAGVLMLPPANKKRKREDDTVITDLGSDEDGDINFDEVLTTKPL